MSEFLKALMYSWEDTWIYTTLQFSVFFFLHIGFHCIQCPFTPNLPGTRQMRLCGVIKNPLWPITGIILHRRGILCSGTKSHKASCPQGDGERCVTLPECCERDWLNPRKRENRRIGRIVLYSHCPRGYVERLDSVLLSLFAHFIAVTFEQLRLRDSSKNLEVFLSHWDCSESFRKLKSRTIFSLYLHTQWHRRVNPVISNHNNRTKKLM